MVNHTANKSSDDVIRLLLRKKGADLHELLSVGPKQAAATTMKMAERRGFKTSQMKLAGSLTRYYARKRVGGKTVAAKKRAVKK